MTPTTVRDRSITAHTGTADETVGKGPISPPDELGTLYKENLAQWSKIEDLRTVEAMRLAGTKYLPQEEGEEDDAYQARLEKSWLFYMLHNTIDEIVATPFERKIIIKGAELPEQLQPIEDNADLAGTSLTEFGQCVYRAAWEMGSAHVLVDMPSKLSNLSGADEMRVGKRPAWRLYDALETIGWLPERTAAGGERLFQVRFRENRIEPDGLYGDKRWWYIRVITGPTGPTLDDVNAAVEAGADFETEMAAFEAKAAEDIAGQWIAGKITREQFLSEGGHKGYQELFRSETKAGGYKIAPGGERKEYSFPGIPLRTMLIGRQTSLMTADPALRKLADTNTEHWQESSDQKKAVRFARFGVWITVGVDPEEIKRQGGGKALGPGTWYIFPDKDADMKVVEHGGTGGLEIGQQAVEAVEARGEIQGAAPFDADRQNQTATARVAEGKTRESMVKASAFLLEDMLRACFEMSARWYEGGGDKVEIDEDLTIDVFTEFVIQSTRVPEAKLLLEARLAGEISQRKLLEEWKSLDLLDAQTDVDEMIAETQEERIEAAAAAMAVATGAGVAGAAGGGASDLLITTEVNDHRHTYKVGATKTSSSNGHTHAIADNGDILEANGHTHKAAGRAEEAD